jgi:hypothetical protein
MQQLKRPCLNSSLTGSWDVFDTTTFSSIIFWTLGSTSSSGTLPSVLFSRAGGTLSANGGTVTRSLSTGRTLQGKQTWWI